MFPEKGFLESSFPYNFAKFKLKIHHEIRRDEIVGPVDVFGLLMAI
jgi:hypothetical protein